VVGRWSFRRPWFAKLLKSQRVVRAAGHSSTTDSRIGSRSAGDAPIETMRLIQSVSWRFPSAWRVERRAIFRKNGVPTLILRKMTRRVYHTTGFSKDEITELCALVNSTGISSGGDGYPVPCQKSIRGFD
jgi:hypothetical protein